MMGVSFIYKSAAFKTISLIVFCLCLSYLNRNAESMKLIAPEILLASCSVSSNDQPQAPQGKL